MAPIASRHPFEAPADASPFVMQVRLCDVTRLLVGPDGDVSALAKELQCVSRHVPGDEGARRAGLSAVLLDRDGAYQGDAPTVRTFTDLPQLIMAEWAD